MSFVLRLLLARNQRAAQYVTEHHYATTGADVDVSFSGAQAGDFAIIFAVDNIGISGLSGWTSVGSQSWGGNVTAVYSRGLSSGDILTGKVTVSGTGNGGIIAIAIYRGASTVTIKSTATGSSTSLAVPGITKNVRCAAVLTFIGNGASSGGTIAVPSGTHARISPFGSGLMSGALADIIPPSGYASGAALTWTGLNASSNNAGGMILELT